MRQEGLFAILGNFGVLEYQRKLTLEVKAKDSDVSVAFSATETINSLPRPTGHKCPNVRASKMAAFCLPIRGGMKRNRDRDL